MVRASVRNCILIEETVVALAENEKANAWLVYISTQDIYTKALWIRKSTRKLGNDRRRDTYAIMRRKKGERDGGDRRREKGGLIYTTNISWMYIYEVTTSPYGPSDNPYHSVCERYGGPAMWYPSLRIQTGFLEVG